ncbi:hypothetical protein HZP65_15020 [Elizabethkingia anophelis]|nr:hypothetical protein [Elizabethkingia anophelis]MCT4277504.1 hypothetical protein [Elizabethkingia anophelis]MCT4281066.1 hypothetical protein [Elizabethkingia anophelis]MDV3768437.1 hypothetical protein [Elizabethkingia anophelis]
MKNKIEWIAEIDAMYNDCKKNIESYAINVNTMEELSIFYDKSLKEFYTFMPYYSFNIYIQDKLDYLMILELNQYGLNKSVELHNLYTGLFKKIKDKIR